MNRTAYDSVKIARGNNRPTGLDYIKEIFTEFFELHGDRRFADDPAVTGGVARLSGRPVTVIAIEKGHTVKERAARFFGAPGPEGYRDTSGAYCGVGAEERGQGQAIAENLMTMMSLSVPVISVLIGEGGSGGALALAVADRVWMLENAIYSVISPEGCASILWKDAKKAGEAAACLKLTAQDAQKFGFVEEVISEEQLGQPLFYADLGRKLKEELGKLSELEVSGLKEQRYERFRAFGRSSL